MSPETFVRAESPEPRTPAAESRVDRPIVTRTFTVLGVVAMVGFALLAWRFLFGIGSVTNLNDGYPWGIWIAFDVVVGTGIACGGYAMAILVYVFNKGRFHPLVRSAVLTAGLGYSMAGFAVFIDLGRYWNMWKIPVSPLNWNLSSVLLEVALCITVYSLVVWLELAPAFVQKFRDEGRGRAQAIAESLTPRIDAALPWLLALGVLLPTMHQSSLGSLMLLAGQKLHPLWHTPFLPLLFLVSVVALGFAGVVLESTFSSRVFGRKVPTGLLRDLAPAIGWTMLAYSAIRLVDVVLSGELGLAVALDGASLLFLFEMTLFIGVGAALLVPRLVRRERTLIRLALAAVFVSALYRFSVFLIAYTPESGGWNYFPAVSEILITAGLLAAEVMLYLVLVKTFPILHGHAPVAAAGTR